MVSFPLITISLADAKRNDANKRRAVGKKNFRGGEGRRVKG